MPDTPQDGAQAPGRHSGVRRAFVASLTGTALEWYDFAVHSAGAAVDEDAALAAPKTPATADAARSH
ncbi:hypothetical protein ACIRPX_09855 [Streptomyces sp. NPDC101225]|uniref:hypothetical protein n=1 Tax=Streptomyces sp. NPDC101225 TaxID=3366135 RepID=UPI0037FA6B92